jgi:hypothetical protein
MGRISMRRKMMENKEQVVKQILDKLTEAAHAGK